MPVAALVAAAALDAVAALVDVAGRFVSAVVASLQPPRPEALFQGYAAQEDISSNFENI